MTTGRLSDAIERARKEASSTAKVQPQRPGNTRPAGSGRPRIASQGLSETEAKWDKILKPDFL